VTAPALVRKTFTVSRLAEFASTAELTKAIGHPVELWPFVIAKELIDNSLDACEAAGLAPKIAVLVDQRSITVADCGPGIAPETVASVVDFTIRTSSREAYVSPTRGAQGNALQTIFAMGFALSQSGSETLIESEGAKHTIAVVFDPIRRIPPVEHSQTASAVRNGVRVWVAWPDSACSILCAARAGFLPLAESFSWLNPHLSLVLNLDGVRVFEAQPTDPAWSKWLPSQPTSPHWYTAERLSRLIGATIAHAQDRGLPSPFVRDFIAEFAGLSGTAKRRDICEKLGAQRLTLAEFFAKGDEMVRDLLFAMREASRPVRPDDLGFLGKDHLRRRMTEVGAHPATFAYRRIALVADDGLPHAGEVAFAWAPEAREREFVSGLNFSPIIGGNPFRIFGSHGSLDGLLELQRAGASEPVVFALHLSAPRLNFLDRGKAQLSLPYEVAVAFAKVVESATANWAAQRKREERERRAILKRRDALIKRHKPGTLKEAAWRVMPQAFAVASHNGRLPANPRQIYYAARGPILEATGKESLDSSYFTQTLLVDYIEETGVAWDIVWDDRGHFREPHTGREFGLGTLAVRDYLASRRDPEIVEARIASAAVQTSGPKGRYRAALFIEKEGFRPILDAASIEERFDIAVMSTKGMSTSAARQLIDGLAADGVRLLVLHDFDVAGFSIRKTLTESGRRHRFTNVLDFVDLGLRLADVERLGLESEPVTLGKDREALAERLRVNGATEAEIEFLMSRRRVELNAMPSDMFIRFVENGLRAHQVEKVIPGASLLANAYAVMKRSTQASTALAAELERLNADPVETPADLANEVGRRLSENPIATWDEVVRAIAEEDA
jgi:DNA topoisomerase VI subunit B